MSIEPQTTTVFRANGHRYLTLKAACRAEAKGIWRRMLAAQGEAPEDHWHDDLARIERVASALYRRFVRRKTSQESL